MLVFIGSMELRILVWNVYLSQEFSKIPIKLIKQKGHYWYEYMNSFSRFDETKLPKKEDFYSTLTDKRISDKDHEHALKRVWNEKSWENVMSFI